MNDAFWLGVNYWPPRKAMYWWKEFDRVEVDEEFAQISEWGIGLVRFFLLWEDFQPRPDQVNHRQLDNLITVLDTAERHGLLATPTLLVGNMSGVMWFPRWAFGQAKEQGKATQISEGQVIDRALRPIFSGPGMLRAETLLAFEAARAVAGHPALHGWDLANEIDQARLPLDENAAWLWAWALTHALRDADPDVSVTYGAHSLSLTTRGLALPAIAPSLSYLAMHGYPIYSSIARGPLDPDFVPFITELTAH
ncbi:MAG: beta-galactosidase, partial [Chloroflexota bacterium]